MINSSGQLQNTTILNGISNQNPSAQKNVKKVLFFTVIMLYFYFGKWNIFTICRVSTDYLFWAIIAGVLCVFVVFNPIIKIKKGLTLTLIYLAYQLFELLNSSYRSTAIPVFVFNILTIMVFLFVKDRAGYEKTFIKCLFYGGIYYTTSVLLQAVFPNMINSVRAVLLTSADVATALRGFENTTRYLAGFGANSAITAFFISMMVGISMSKVLLNIKTVKNLIISLFGMVALFLTQKRSLALGTILAIFIVLYLFKKDIAKKLRFALAAIILGSIGLYILYRISPAMTIFMNRLFNNQDLLSGRNNMYEVMATWFQSNKMFGTGIGTANYFFGFGGHNCYRQLLAEEGIIGCIIFALLVLPYIFSLFGKLYLFWNALETNDDTEILLSAAICITIILIYAFVGNPFYDFTFCLTLFMLLAVPTQIINT